jgi:hypothetical protein
MDGRPGFAELQQHDRVAAGIRARVEQLKGAAARNRERCLQAGRDSIELAVMAGVGHHEDESVDEAVTPLERELPSQRLLVRRSRLCLDAATNGRIESGHDGIPRAEIARARERRFGPDPEPRMALCSEALEHGAMPGIAEWIAGRVEPNRKLQSEHRGDPRELVDRNLAVLAAFDPAETPPTDPCRGCRVILRQPGAQTGDPDLRDAGRDELPAARRPDIERSLPGGHRGTMTARAHRRLMSGADLPARGR